MKKSRKKSCNWTVREWGSFASIASALLLVWLNFGPRYREQQARLPGGV